MGWLTVALQTLEYGLSLSELKFPTVTIQFHVSLSISTENVGYFLHALHRLHAFFLQNSPTPTQSCRPA